MNVPDGHSVADSAGTGTHSARRDGPLVPRDAGDPALTAVDLFSDRDKLARVRAEFEERRGTDFRYDPLLWDRDPPLDYRASVVR